jgi:hypothetical protein
MRTTAKPVVNKLQQHIKEFYQDNHEDWLKGLIQDVNSQHFGTRSLYQAATELVLGGNFLIYHFDVNNFMNDLDINDKQKDYTDEETWNLYVHLLAREICKLY